MQLPQNTSELKEQLVTRLSRFLGVTPRDADDVHYYKALAGILRDLTGGMRAEFTQGKPESKRVYYLSMEFLMGRSLKNTLFNLGLTQLAEEALGDFGVRLEKLYDCEPDPGLATAG